MIQRLYYVLFILIGFTSSLHCQQAIKSIIGPELNGIKQRLLIEGKDDNKPLLLFLHGGPGFGSSGYAKKFVKELRNDFIIVQWDQRNTGATKAWNPENTALSVELMHNDTQAVVDFLLEEFNRKKLYLVGFSWGSFLGVHYAQNHAEKLYAYISVSGLVNGNASEEKILSDLKDKASEKNDIGALQELNSIAIPFENGEDLFLQRKWTGAFFPESMESTKLKKNMVENWSKTWLPIFNQAASVDYSKEAPKIECPVYFFHSPQDRVSHFAIAKAYYEQLNAPEKQWIEFDGAPHEIVSAQPKEFSKAIIELTKQ